MFIELQLSASVFERLFQNQLKANEPCLAFTQFDAAGETFVVDKIEIVDPTDIQRDPGPPRQFATILSLTGNIAQIQAPFFQVKPTLAITLVKKSDLVANGVNPSSPASVLPGLPAAPITLQPVFDVSVFVKGNPGAGGPVQLSYSLFSVDYGPLAALVPDSVKTTIQNALGGITLPPVTVDFSGLLTTLGSAPAVVSNCGIMCDAAASLVALRLEFQRETDSVTQFQSFFTAGPVSRLQPASDWAMFVDSRLLVATATDVVDKAMAKTSNIDITSGPDGSWNGSGIDISLHGTALGACKATGGDIDFAADLTVTFSVPSINLVGTHLHLDVSPSNLFQVALCSFVAASFWPFLGPLMTGLDNLGNIAAYLGVQALEPLYRMIGLMFAIETHGISEDLSSDLGNNWHKIDDDNYESDDSLDPNKLRLPGLNAQLEFDGSVAAPDGMIYGGKTILGPFLSGSVVAVTSTPFSWRLSGSCQTSFTGTNYATIFVAVISPAKLCSAALLGTPATDYTITANGNDLTIAPVRHRTSLGEFVLPSEPCVLTVITTDGVRIVTLQPPAEENAQDQAAIQRGIIIARGNCYKLTKGFSVLDKLHWVEQAIEEGYLQGWHVSVNNVRGQTVELLDEHDRLLLTAHGAPNAIAQGILLLDRAHATPDLTIRLGGRELDADATLNVTVQQILFAPRSSVKAPEPLVGLSFTGGARGARLMASSAARSAQWSVKRAALPLLEQSLAETGSGAPVVVHTGAGLSGVLSAKAQAALRSAWSRAQDYTVVGTPRVDSVDETLYLGFETHGTLWNIADAHKPTVLQVFHTAPWFLWTASFGRLLARRDPVSRLVNIYEVVGEQVH